MSWINNKIEQHQAEANRRDTTHHPAVIHVKPVILMPKDIQLVMKLVE
jgi:hypothetical protein